MDLLAVLIALLHGVLAFTAVCQKSPTFDEPTHFAAGYSYWLRNDFRLDAEAGQLPQRWAALPLLWTHANFVAADAPSWTGASQGDVGTEFLYDVGNDAARVMRQGRAMMTLVSVALCLLIYAWSKQLFGPLGGLISVTLAAFCPNLLAHGPLVTSDVTSAFFFTASVWSFWRMLRQPTFVRALVCGVATAGLFLSKMSAALILPMMPALLALSAAEEWRDAKQLRRTLRASGWTVFVGMIALALVWGAFSFRYSARTEWRGDTQQNRQWSRILASPGLVERTVAFARDHRLLPEAYLYGFSYARKSTDVRPAFLDHQWSVTGFADFFPRAFLYKAPLPTLLMLVLGALAVVLWSRKASEGQTVTPSWRVLYESAPLWVLIAVYGGFALTAGLNIGHRHLLPIYPALFVVCGSCALLWRRRVAAAQIAIVVLLIWQLAESVAIRPDYLAYFNEFAGGSRHGYEHLVDSSLDWGQDLPALGRWLDQNSRGERPVYLGYFGTARPAYYGVRAIQLPENPAPLGAGIYCISATTLQQVYSVAMGAWTRQYEDAYRTFRAAAEHGADPTDRRAYARLRFARLCAMLRHRAPTADVGHSILIYDLSDEDLRMALDGPPAEFFAESQVLGLR